MKVTIDFVRFDRGDRGLKRLLELEDMSQRIIDLIDSGQKGVCLIDYKGRIGTIIKITKEGRDRRFKRE